MSSIGDSAASNTPTAAGDGFTILWACCHGGRKRKGIGFLHNCRPLRQAFHQPWCEGHPGLLDYEVEEFPDGSLQFDTELEAEYPYLLCVRYMEGLKFALSELACKFLPLAPSAREDWLLAALKESTARLGRLGVRLEVAPAILSLVGYLVKGSEGLHLSELLRHRDYRGSDVRLSTQTLVEGSRQEWPYPAFVWRWESKQAYGWKHQQHINVLEFMAFLTNVRSCTNSVASHGRRIFHIFDSKVAAAVAAKGRPSAKVLNRPLRRYAAFSIAANFYVQCLWTISSWNFADAASRLRSPGHGS